jgi:hypothetical protein
LKSLVNLNKNFEYSEGNWVKHSKLLNEILSKKSINMKKLSMYFLKKVKNSTLKTFKIY